MRLRQAINEKISMCDRIILALSGAPGADPDEVEAMVDFMVEERQRLQTEGRMLDDGWLDEVRGLVAAGVAEQAPAMRALGYRELLGLLRGELSRDEAIERITVLCQRFAKRQTTWFNRVPSIHWLEPEEDMVKRVIELSRPFLGRGAGS